MIWDSGCRVPNTVNGISGFRDLGLALTGEEIWATDVVPRCLSGGLHMKFLRSTECWRLLFSLRVLGSGCLRVRGRLIGLA